MVARAVEDRDRRIRLLKIVAAGTVTLQAAAAGAVVLMALNERRVRVAVVDAYRAAGFEGCVGSVDGTHVAWLGF